MNKKNTFLIALILCLIAVFAIQRNKAIDIPTIAIANYGPHSSLEATITGVKQQLKQAGYVENQNIRFEIADVGFDPALIPQMISSLKAKHPKLVITLTTPVTQAAKAKIKDIPLVYSAITDPVEAGLLKTKYTPDTNMTGSSDMQDLSAMLQFVKTILPNVKRVGLLYSSAESNDAALVNMMKNSASKLGMEVVAIPIEQARDVAIRIQEFKNKVDFIYVGTSGPIQPTLPIIAAEASKMNIPVINADEQAVKDGLALASFGVDYLAVGRNTGKLVAAILKGKNLSELAPIYPSKKDHHGVINKQQAAKFNATIPQNAKIVS